MNPASTIATFLVYAALAGLCGALAMTAVMKLVARTGWARGDMIVAVGSLFTKTRATAFSVGWFYTYCPRSCLGRSTPCC
jgi:hypothetical protein